MAIKTIKTYFGSPIFAIAVVFFILAGISWLFTKNVPQTNLPPKQPPHKVLAAKYLPKPTTSPSLSITVNYKIKQEKISRTISSTIIPISITNAQPTNTSEPQATSTPVPMQTINLQLNEPDGNFNFSLDFHSGSNPCSILNDAKSEGKIKSVTITHYGAPLNSDYIKEINNYSDNWTFTLNGISEPKGCSSYTLSSGNTVVWKYN